MEHQMTCWTIHQTNHLNLKKKDWPEINDDSHETYNNNSQIGFKTMMLRLCLCGYNDVHIFKGTITVPNMEARSTAGELNKRGKITNV